MAKSAQYATYRFGSFALDLERGTLLAADGEEIPLRPKSFAVLQFLVENAGRLLSREAIMEAVWPNIFVMEDNVTQCVHDVRRALRAEAHQMLRTFPRRGYLFASNVTGVPPLVNSLPRNNGIDDRTGSGSPAPGGGKPLEEGQRVPEGKEKQHLFSSVLLAKAPRLSLVVLPFASLGGNASENYLANVITEDLTAELFLLPAALVIARHSAASYKDKPISVRQIAEELNVRYVVEGSVRKLGDLLHVNAKLISTDTNAHIWMERFDQNVRDLEVGPQAIVNRLKTGLTARLFQTESERSARERPNDPGMLDLLLCAWSMLCKNDHPELLSEASGLFEQALRLDPASKPALYGLISELMKRFAYDGADFGDENLINQAAILIASLAEIEPTNEQVIYFRGYLALWLGHWAEALVLFRRLVELFPSTPSGLCQLGLCKLAVGQPDAAIPLLQRSIGLDPLALRNRYAQRRIGQSLLLLGRDSDSIEWLQRALAADPMAHPRWRAQCHLFMASAYALSGQLRDAHRALADADRLWPFATVRSGVCIMSARGLPHPAYMKQMRRMQEGLRLAGLRDHAEEGADFGMASSGALLRDPVGPTPTTVPGAKTIHTDELVDLMANRTPLLIDLAPGHFDQSIPGAIGLQGTGNRASFSDRVQHRFRRMMQELTKGDLSASIVVFSVNSERRTGYNLALRLVSLCYKNVYWYRGGFEAWQVNGLPETDLVLHEW